MRIVFLAPLAALGMAACTYQANVPLVDGAGLGTIGSAQPGRFAATVQTGGWNLDAKVAGMSCSAHTYKADLDQTWEQAMKAALTSALQKVDFVPASLPPKDLSAKGYTAQLGFMQSNASSQISMLPNFFTATETSETKLDGILTIAYPDGTLQQQPIQGQGSASGEVASCGNVAPLEQSSALAVKDIVQRAALTAKLLLAQRQPQ